jgi:predicted DNA-binding transcriptional regulator AlpA
MSDDGYVEQGEICRDVFFGITRGHLWRMRKHARFPKPIGKCPLYFNKEAVLAWRKKYWNREAIRYE